MGGTGSEDPSVPSVLQPTALPLLRAIAPVRLPLLVLVSSRPPAFRQLGTTLSPYDFLNPTPTFVVNSLINCS